MDAPLASPHPRHDAYAEKRAHAELAAMIAAVTFKEAAQTTKTPGFPKTRGRVTY